MEQDVWKSLTCISVSKSKANTATEITSDLEDSQRSRNIYIFRDQEISIDAEDPEG